MILSVLFAILELVLGPQAHAQGAIVGSSSSALATTAGARQSVFDSTSNLYWAFWYNGSGIEYASSSDAVEWSEQGVLPYDTPHFSVSYKALAGAGHVLLALEYDSFDIGVLRGVLSGDLLQFDAVSKALDGSSSNDSYRSPSIDISDDGRAWVAGIHNSGGTSLSCIGEVSQSIGLVSAALTFGSAQQVGMSAMHIADISLTQLSGNEMMLVMGGFGGDKVVAHHFDGSVWQEIAGGSTLSSINLTSGGISITNYPWTPYSNGGGMVVMNGEVYVGHALQSDFVGREVGYIAKWNGSSWESLGQGVNGGVGGMFTDGTNLYVSGSFTKAGGLDVDYIAKWDGSSWSSMGSAPNAGAAFIRSFAWFGGELYATG